MFFKYRSLEKLQDLSLTIHLQVKVIQLCLTVCNPMNYTVHGILQDRILELVAFKFIQNWEEVTEIPHILPAPLLLTSPIRFVHLLEFMNQYLPS